MTNVVRLVNGGAIQVRTGVLQGIGPQGPRGLVGPQGQQGEQGPIGETGPMGQILQMMGRTDVSTNNPLAANTDTVIAFGSVVYDDLSCFTSTANVTLTAPGDYLLSTWLRFDDAAAGYRDIWFTVSSTIIARASRGSVPGAPFYCDLSYPFRAAGGEVINVLARSGQASAISAGRLNVSRVGSGPPGPIGPVGVAGPVGAAGPTGPAGPAGSANSGFTKYSDLLPH